MIFRYDNFYVPTVFTWNPEAHKKGFVTKIYLKWNELITFRSILYRLLVKHSQMRSKQLPSRKNCAGGISGQDRTTWPKLKGIPRFGEPTGIFYPIGVLYYNYNPNIRCQIVRKGRMKFNYLYLYFNIWCQENILKTSVSLIPIIPCHLTYI